jgi:uncharacterized protein DUF4259
VGTWGPGNFDSDDAMEFVDEMIETLRKVIEDCLQPENFKVFWLEHFGEYRLIPAVDMILTLCERYATSPGLEEVTARSWKELYLWVYDETVDTFGPKPEWKINRRKAIEKTFERLEELAKEWA